MNDLLAFAVEAHGGLDRWKQFQTVTAHLSITGAIWDYKQAAGLLLDKTFQAWLHEQRLTVTPFIEPDQRSVFVPGRLTFESLDGFPREFRDDPEASFAGHTAATPWDHFHAAFFTSEALWTYLTSPFLYTQPGFVTEEIEPWREQGVDEVWRRLKVTFPEHIVSHTKEQVTHFGPDGLMRRHDYTVDILGGATGANYTTDYKAFQGIMMPTARRIYAYDAALQKVSEPLLVKIDIDDIRFA